MRLHLAGFERLDLGRVQRRTFRKARGDISKGGDSGPKNLAQKIS